jgi:hypothetical protein
MGLNLNPLEKKLVKSFFAGVVGTVAVVAAEILYVIPQKPIWTGKEAAVMMVAVAVPMIMGTIPLVYHEARELYKDIRDNGFYQIK